MAEEDASPHRPAPFVDEAGSTAVGPALAAAPDSMAAEAAEPLGAQGLLHFLGREELTDCVVRLTTASDAADGAPSMFKCHRIVLCAASGYFCARLLTGGPGEVELPELPDDPEVSRQVDVGALFPLVLRYAYSDQRWETIEADVGPENAMGLFALAAALEIPSLASKAFELVMASSLSPDSAVRLLYTAARLSNGLEGFGHALASCIEAVKHCFAEACSSSEDLTLFCQLPVEVLISVLDADDLCVPTEGTVLEVVRSVLQVRIPQDSMDKEEAAGGKIWAAKLCDDEPSQVLNTVRFPHLEHEELLKASQDAVLMQAGAQEQVLQALSARLGRYEHADLATSPSRPPRPSTLGAGNRTLSRPVAGLAAAAATAIKSAADDPFSGGWPGSALDVRRGSVVASLEEPLFFQRRSGDFDEGGALYWLGTKGQTQAWRNPVGLGYVTPISSGVGCGKLEDIVGRQVVNLRTSNLPDSYFGVDFHLDRLLVLQGYCLRNRNMTSHVLMSWTCEGSLDGENWEILDTRTRESSLRATGATAFFEVQKVYSDEQMARGLDASRAFRFFRLLQTDVNSSGSHNLVLSGVEFYGYAVGGTWP